MVPRNDECQPRGSRDVDDKCAQEQISEIIWIWKLSALINSHQRDCAIPANKGVDSDFVDTPRVSGDRSGRWDCPGTIRFRSLALDPINITASPPDNYVSRPRICVGGGEERGARSIGTDITPIRSRSTLDPLTPGVI